jgi:hypothetical protein
MKELADADYIDRVLAGETVMFIAISGPLASILLIPRSVF